MSDTYDYIILGAGTAGCVLANRLSESGDKSVLVIEAGEYLPDDQNVNTPGLMANLYDKPKYDWGYASIPQEHCSGKRVGHSRGKLVGGSSAIQYGMIVFPSKAGIDAWEALGNEGWGWEGMAPYYRKFHTMGMPSKQATVDLSLQYIDKELIGTDGPLQVSFAGEDFYSTLQTSWPKTFHNLGLDITADPLTGLTTGAFTNPCSVDPVHKKRSHSGVAYYNAEVAKRTNLTLVTEALVEKILFEGEEGVATGVQYKAKDGSIQQPKTSATGEVLVCAGAFGSPQILELSGIGDAKLLESLGIKTIVDNPYVGENLQDHALVSISYEVEDGIPTIENVKEPGVLDTLIQLHQSTASGPLTSSCISSAYLPIQEFQVEGDRPELTKMLDENLVVKDGDHPGYKKQWDLLRSIVEDRKDSSIQYFSPAVQLDSHIGFTASEWFGMAEDGHYDSIAASYAHPFSRGSTHINSADPAVYPTIDPKYLSNELDLEIFARHVLWIETIAKTEPLASCFKKDGRRVPPNTYLKTLDEAKQFVRDTLVSTYHPACSCPMMPRELGGVVDNKLKVYGTKNVRVCDASIFPIIPRGNPQTSVYAVGEKGADIIKSEA